MVGPDEQAAAYAAAVCRAMNPQPAALRRCQDCGQPERPWVPVHDPAGRVTGWRGPTCARKQGTGPSDQLALDQEGTDR